MAVCCLLGLQKFDELLAALKRDYNRSELLSATLPEFWEGRGLHDGSLV